MGGIAPGVILDVDGTLYSTSSACAVALRERHREIFVRTTGLDGDDGMREYARLTDRYGLALVGAAIVNGHDVDAVLGAAHDIDHATLIDPSPGLRRRLTEVPGPIIAWSNAPSAHVEGVLVALGIRETIDDVVPLERFRNHPKPSRRSFSVALEHLGRNPSQAVLFEDSPSTLKRARELGMATVAIGLDAAMDYPDIDAALDAPRVRGMLGLGPPGVVSPPPPRPRER